MIKAKLLISLFCLTGFFISAQTGVTIIDSIYSNGIYRTYRLYRPNIYNGTQAVPLVINLHGYTSNALSQQYYGNFMPISDTANFLIVHPQGTKDASNQPYWNAGISPSGANDLLFISQLIDSLKLSFNIDNNCIYSTGLSNGGFMSNYLACQLSNKIAAIAGVAGTMFTNWYTSCNPGRPVPVMHIHGTSDATVPYSGNSSMIAVDTLIKQWRIKNNCNSIPTFSSVPNINTSDGCTADHFLYSGGNSNSTIELYRVNNGGHTWPGASVIIGVTNQDFNASVEIWRFFRKYKLNFLTSFNDLVLNGNEDPLLFPNPTASFVQIEKKEYKSFSLMDAYGNLIINKSQLSIIDVSDLENGIYYLVFENKNKRITKKLIKIN